MADEAVLLIQTEIPIPFTVADGTGIEKGAFLELADLMTAEAAETGDYIAGIAASEKIANDGNTQLGIFRGGIFKGTFGGTAVTAGQTLALSGSNKLRLATAADVDSKTIGIAMETAALNETFKFELRPGCANHAYS
jgi:hypothetical protein